MKKLLGNFIGAFPIRYMYDIELTQPTTSFFPPITRLFDPEMLAISPAASLLNISSVKQSPGFFCG